MSWDKWNAMRKAMGRAFGLGGDHKSEKQPKAPKGKGPGTAKQREARSEHHLNKQPGRGVDDVKGPVRGGKGPGTAAEREARSKAFLDKHPGIGVDDVKAHHGIIIGEGKASSKGGSDKAAATSKEAHKTSAKLSGHHGAPAHRAAQALHEAAAKQYPVGSRQQQTHTRKADAHSQTALHKELAHNKNEKAVEKKLSDAGHPNAGRIGIEMASNRREAERAGKSFGSGVSGSGHVQIAHNDVSRASARAASAASDAASKGNDPALHLKAADLSMKAAHAHDDLLVRHGHAGNAEVSALLRQRAAEHYDKAMRATPDKHRNDVSRHEAGAPKADSKNPAAWLNTHHRENLAKEKAAYEGNASGGKKSITDKLTKVPENELAPRNPRPPPRGAMPGSRSMANHRAEGSSELAVRTSNTANRTGDAAKHAEAARYHKTAGEAHQRAGNTEKAFHHYGEQNKHEQAALPAERRDVNRNNVIYEHAAKGTRPTIGDMLKKK